MSGTLRPYSGFFRSKKSIPRGGLIINYNNPLVTGLIAAFLPGLYYGDFMHINGDLQYHDYVHASASAGLYAASPEGPSFGNLTNGTYSLTQSGGQVSPLIANWTGQATYYIRLFQVASTGNNNGCFYLYDPTSGNISMGLSGVAGTTNQYALFWGAVGANFSTLGAGLAVSQVHGLCGSMISGGSSVLYADGVSYSTTSSLTSSSLTQSTTMFAINSLADVQILALYVWNRALTNQEALELESDPYGIFMPVNNYLMLFQRDGVKRYFVGTSFN